MKKKIIWVFTILIGASVGFFGMKACVDFTASARAEVQERRAEKEGCKYGPQTNKEEHISKEEHTRNSAKFTHEIRAFIERRWKETTTYYGLAELVNGYFGTAFTYTQINNFTNRQGYYYDKHKNTQGGAHE